MKFIKNVGIYLIIAILIVQYFFEANVSSAASADIWRAKDPISYGGSMVGEFKVNGYTAFCVQHDKSTTPTGSANKGESVYSNAKIRRALYYGWDGPENIFGNDKARGYVVTSLVLSRLYTGEDAGGHSIDGYSDLWNKAQSGSIPNANVSFSDHNLTTKIGTVPDHTGNKQVSQSTTLNADPDNSVTFNLPDGIHLYNQTKGTSGVGKETVKGGQTFFLWAELNYNNNWSSGDVYGSMKPFQAILTDVSNNSLQNLMRGGTWDADPPLPDGISANFYPRTVQMTIHHKDRQTNEELDTETKTVTIGTYYEEHSRDDFWHNGIDEFEDGDQTANGTVPSNNFDVTFWYHTKWTIHKQYVDTHDGHVMWTEDVPNVWAGQWYDEWPSTGEFDRDGHHYKETGNNHYTGNMPRGDLWIQYYYDEYNHTRVTWKNQYPNNDVFQYKDDLIKVGDHYFYDQPATFTIWNGAIFDRNDGSVFDGNQPNWDQDHTFLYRLRRHVEVNYYDNRTGQKIKESKEYDLHQGDHWDEDHPNITTSKDGRDYTYRYVRESGSAEHGTIGTDNVVINYYYDIPLIQAGVKKLQIYTAPADEGLPVKVYLDKANNYDYGIGDMGSKQISVSLYQGDTRYEEKRYSAKDLPTYLTFKIPKDKLSVNEHKPYTVRLENYDTNDFDIISSERELTTDGYTSSEDTVDLYVQTDPDHEDVQQRVAMTEVEARQTPDQKFEHIDYGAQPLPAKKTGYGVETKAFLTYWSDLGSEYNYATSVNDNSLTFQAPESLQDSYLDYPVKDGKVNVSMKNSDDNSFLSDGSYYRLYGFIFPHVNVEDVTGKLFTDKQVADHDSRIKNTIYDGHNEFYTPIWPAKGEDIPKNYSVDYLSNDIGVNKVKFRIDDQIRIYAYMIGWMGSPTIKDDNIVVSGVDTQIGFTQGLPSGWTQKDLDWLKSK
ncbi:MAG: hypothetical protein K0Q87_170 [Neobacillus sp.]|jgi:hypothetical protein|nr:hypothetical protein [Neobacillus sp.]